VITLNIDQILKIRHNLFSEALIELSQIEDEKDTIEIDIEKGNDLTIPEMYFYEKSASIYIEDKETGNKIRLHIKAPITSKMFSKPLANLRQMESGHK